MDPLGELGEFGSSLIRQSLPPNTPVQINFKTAEKLSMNQMKQQQLQHQQHLSTTPTVAPTSNCNTMNLSKNTIPSPMPSSVAAAGVSSVGVPGSSIERGNGMDSLLNLDLLSGGLSSDSHSTTTATTAAAPTATVDTLGSLLDDRPPLNDAKNLIGSVSSNVASEAKSTIKNTKEVRPKVKEDKENRISTPKPQFMEVKPMTDLKVTLESIKPGK